MKLIGSDGPVTEGYVDGYSFADTLLEGVLFKVAPSATDPNTLVSYGPIDAAEYMSQFVPSQIEAWGKQAVEVAIESGCQNLDGSDDIYWEEA